MQKVDVAIVGGGMVGLTLALALAQQDKIKVAVIEQFPAQPHGTDAELRVSAINAASQNIFAHLDVWSDITAQRLAPYHHMKVWEKNGFGEIKFDRQEVNQQQLGWIIENKVIRQALWQKALSKSNITLISQDQIAQFAIGDGEVFITFEKSTPITAKLIVGADGANSWVRKQCDIPLTFWDYDHHALVATVHCEAGHQDTAWQVFLPEGPLALLPLFDANLCSIVWSQPPTISEQLLKLDKTEFNKQITAATDGKLGLLSLQSERLSFPLTMRYARDFVKSRVALVGDAAHTIHPLAGQGVNLGLLDAASLAQEVLANYQQGKDIGQQINLAGYNRWRKTQAADMVAAMEVIKRGFAPQHPVAKLVRGLGMSLFDQFTPIKQLMVKQALGEKSDLPDLALSPDPLV